jgi:hypothetical protein
MEEVVVVGYGVQKNQTSQVQFLPFKLRISHKDPISTPFS